MSSDDRDPDLERVFAAEVGRGKFTTVEEARADFDIKMDQAIADAKLAPNEISNERTGIIMGSGGPSTKTIVDSADIARTKGVKKIGPFAVPKAMSSTSSATLATWFKIKGLNFSIASACATSNHCIGTAYEAIRYGKQDIMFAGGCEELDWTLAELFDAMGAMSSAFNDRPAVASLV